MVQALYISYMILHVLLCVAWLAFCVHDENKDPSAGWAALGIAIFFNPLGNLALLLVALVFTIIMQWLQVMKSVAWGYLLATVVPVVGCIANFALLRADLHGC